MLKNKPEGSTYWRMYRAVHKDILRNYLDHTLEKKANEYIKKFVQEQADVDKIYKFVTFLQVKSGIRE